MFIKYRKTRRGRTIFVFGFQSEDEFQDIIKDLKAVSHEIADRNTKRDFLRLTRILEYRTNDRHSVKEMQL